MRRRAALVALPFVAGCAAVPPPRPQDVASRYPIGDAATWYQPAFRVGSWSAMDWVAGLRTRPVQAAGPASPLPAMVAAPPIGYRFRNLAYSLDDYMARQPATGVLVLKDGAIAAERYGYGRTPDARFLSFSMAKSVTSLLFGIAQAQGAIGSLDEPAQRYVAALQGTAYGGTPLRALLRMSSGITFREVYDGQDDVARMSAAFAGSPLGTLSVLRTLDQRHAPAGEVFRYASAETDVLGRVLVAATGRTLSRLTEEWLWQPMGAGRSAFWGIGRDGQEGASGRFNAALRDWGRIAVLLARDGEVGGRQVVPRAWLLDATDPARQPAQFRPRRATAYFGYGYQFWLSPLAERTFAMQGVHGQALYVQPATGIAMVHTAVWPQASGRQEPQAFDEREALWRGVLQTLGGRLA